MVTRRQRQCTEVLRLMSTRVPMNALILTATLLDCAGTKQLPAMLTNCLLDQSGKIAHDTALYELVIISNISCVKYYLHLYFFL